jgi:hypothetical protein
MSWVMRNDMTGDEILPGMVLFSNRDEAAVVGDPIGRPPHKPSSSGRIYVKESGSDREYFPGVFNCTWREE